VVVNVALPSLLSMQMARTLGAGTGILIEGVSCTHEVSKEARSSLLLFYYCYLFDIQSSGRGNKDGETLAGMCSGNLCAELENKLARLARSGAFFNRGTMGTARVARQLRTEIRIAEMPDNDP